MVEFTHGRSRAWVCGVVLLRAAVVVTLLVLALAACAEETTEAPRLGVSTPPVEALPDLEWRPDTITMVGELEGAPDHEFFDLAEASVLSGGEFLVLDSRGGRVAVFDTTGRHLGSIQSQGVGPGELQLPVAHAVTGQGELFVLDAQLGRISQFRVDSGQMEFVGMQSVSQRLRTLCVMNGTVWLGGLIDGKLAHRINQEGEIEFSVGAPPRVDGIEELGEFGEALAYPQLVRPSVYCDEANGLVILPSLSHPRIQAYRESGERVWAEDQPDVTSIQFERTDTGGLRHFSHPERGSHVLFSVVPWGRGQVLVQYGVRRDQEEAGTSSDAIMDSRVIDPATGETLFRSTALPPVLGGNGELFVVAGDELFPQAIVVRRVE